MSDVETIKKAYTKIMQSMGIDEAEEFLAAYDKERNDSRNLEDPDRIDDAIKQATRCVVGGIGLSKRQLTLLMRCSKWSYSLTSILEVNSRYLVSFMAICEGAIRCNVEFSSVLLEKVNDFFKRSEDYLEVGVATIQREDFPSDSLCMGEISSSFRRLQALMPKWISKDFGQLLVEVLNYICALVRDHEKFERVCLPFSGDLMKIAVRGFSLHFKKPAIWTELDRRLEIEVPALEAAGMSITMEVEDEGIFSAASDDVASINENGFDKVHNCYLELNKLADMVSALERKASELGTRDIGSSGLVVYLPSGKSTITVTEAREVKEAFRVWKSDVSTSIGLKLIERAYGDI